MSWCSCPCQLALHGACCKVQDDLLFSEPIKLLADVGSGDRERMF